MPETDLSAEGRARLRKIHSQMHEPTIARAHCTCGDVIALLAALEAAEAENARMEILVGQLNAELLKLGRIELLYSTWKRAKREEEEAFGDTDHGLSYVEMVAYAEAMRKAMEAEEAFWAAIEEDGRMNDQDRAERSNLGRREG